ncbi:MAG: DNA repair protein RecN [Planctomycetota bacterium]|nr:DNA repair protein RecN [Planctomycetota bacterium]
MLVHLTIENLGLIEHAELEMGPGLQVLTGETGVGKSMLLASMAILRGERTRTDLVRRTADRARVRGIFHFDESAALKISELLGSPIEDGELVIEREVRREGRSRCRIDGRENTTTLLRRIAPLLIEVIGQGHALTLLQPGAQLDLLDRFGGLQPLREEHARSWHEARGLATRILHIEEGVRARSDRRLFLEHILEELDQADFTGDERENLEQELELLEDRDRLLASIETVRQRFEQQEDSILDRLAQTRRDLQEMSDLHPGIEALVEGCAGSSILLSDAVRGLAEVESSLDLDAQLLEQKRQRVDQLVTLENRYQRIGVDLSDYREECREQLVVLGGDDDELPELREGLQRCISQLSEGAQRLHVARLAVVVQMVEQSTAELTDLGLGKARLEGQLMTLESGVGWNGMDERGADRFEILFCANPGETLRSIGDVASGGELSRLMLALQRVLAGSTRTGTLVFDEIDSGVGGRLGAAIGEKLNQIGIDHQVLCVTHLPQVACHGARHHRVIKESKGQVTSTRIEEVTGESRIRELASMLRGDRATERSLEEAREMYAEAQGLVRDPGH